MEYLIAVDLEGVNNVKGEPYFSLHTGKKDYDVAVEQAVLEVNMAIKALFDGGATKVVVWDNHWLGENLDFSKIDPRAERQNEMLSCQRRFEFAKNHNFAGAVYIGYHSRAGSINGILSHTYSGTDIQYMKVGGKAYGEFEFDTTCASVYGIKPLFASGDSVFIEQVKEFSPATVTVVTKKALGRNEAEFYDNETVLRNIYEGVLASLKKEIPIVTIPLPAEIEIRYTRSEMAKKEILDQKERYNRDFTYGEDAHVIKYYCMDIEDIKHSL